MDRGECTVFSQIICPVVLECRTREGDGGVKSALIECIQIVIPVVVALQSKTHVNFCVCRQAVGTV